MNHPLSDMMTSSMGKIRDMIDVNTVIGDPISAGDVTIIPVTKVSIGYGAGESVRMLPVAEPASTSMDRLIEQLPDLLDKAESIMKQKRLAKEEGIE